MVQFDEQLELVSEVLIQYIFRTEDLSAQGGKKLAQVIQSYKNKEKLGNISYKCFLTKLLHAHSKQFEKCGSIEDVQQHLTKHTGFAVAMLQSQIIDNTKLTIYQQYNMRSISIGLAMMVVSVVTQQCIMYSKLYNKSMTEVALHLGDGTMN